MKYVLAAMTAAGFLTATGLGVAGVAIAAPTGAASPTDTIKALETKGYAVIVTTVSGNDPQTCSVASVRQGQTTMGKSTEVHGVPTPTPVHQTMYVHLRC